MSNQKWKQSEAGQAYHYLYDQAYQSAYYRAWQVGGGYAKRLKRALAKAAFAEFTQEKKIHKPLQCGYGVEYVGNRYYQNHIQNCVHANAGVIMASVHHNYIYKVQVRPGISATTCLKDLHPWKVFKSLIEQFLLTGAACQSALCI